MIENAGIDKIHGVCSPWITQIGSKSAIDDISI